jgi:ATP-dependent phosphofructokinase / diphosphate-dependent phosphofructokinase
MMVERTGNFLIAQGGGPTAVINASLAGAVLEAIDRLQPASQLWGARGGIRGFLQEDFIDLRAPKRATWDEIRLAPAAALGSCRKKMHAEDLARAVEICRRRDIRHFFYIGGNDSMDTAHKMATIAQQMHYEMHAAGIPKTIDNDLPETDFCPGYGSCARFIAQATLDLGMDIRALPTPVSIMEVIGRNAGWTAAAALLARKQPDDAPHLIYVPEVRLSREKFLGDVKEAYDRHGWVVAVVSEGLCDEQGESLGAAVGEAAIDGFGHKLPGDVAPALAHLITKELGLRARSEKPGLLARASSHHASSVDRDAAEGAGRFAVQHALAGNTDFMAAIVRESNEPFRIRFCDVPLEKAANVERLLPSQYIVETKNDIAESFRQYAEPLLGGPLRRYARLS